jgi:uncharacterized damage-inducible protein DinB
VTMSTHAPPLLRSFGRLATQLDALDMALEGVAAEQLEWRPPSGKWSARENLAHLGRQHEVFLERLRRILSEEAPALEAYRAERDPEWPRWAGMSAAEALSRLRALRDTLLEEAARLDARALARPGVHSRLGPMSLELWIEFFLTHEAHHLYVILKRARGVE